MELRDLIVTPIILFLVYAAAFAMRPLATDKHSRKYFLSGLTVRIIGALALGFIYQFYYEGGDTYNFHTHGSRLIWEAFFDSPEKGIKLLFSDGEDQRGIYDYTSRLMFFGDSSSYAIVRIAAVFDLLTFSSYSATAVLFAVLGFIGSWLLFKTFYKLYPHLHLQIAIASFFIPSVFFWGSGLLKDTVTLAAISSALFSFHVIFIEGRPLAIKFVLLLLLSLYILFAIKVYILLLLLPSLIFWAFVKHLSSVKSVVLKFLLFPFVIAVAGAMAYFSVAKASEDNEKYSMETIAKTAQVTAYDIRYWSGRDAGSGYELGELDGTWQSLIVLAPQAINVSLFRPYLWEVRNPLMLLSAVESLILLLITCFVLIKANVSIVKLISRPSVLFCFLFSVSFAFAVGVSTFNFGTLARYKIPLLPFYFLSLIFILDQLKRERKLAALEFTE